MKIIDEIQTLRSTLRPIVQQYFKNANVDIYYYVGGESVAVNVSFPITVDISRSREKTIEEFIQKLNELTGKLPLEVVNE